MKLPPITKTYGGRRVLDLPALELADGAIHAVVGANGSGKSTLARILAGVIRPDQDSFPRVGQAGYMPQRSHSFRMSVVRNLQLTGAGRDRAMAQLELDKGIAMVVCANYVASEVNNNTGTEINWGMFNYPEVEGGADPSNAYAGSNAIGITSYTENAQAAFDFAMFLVTGEYDQKMADTASQIPADPNNTAPAMLDGTIETLQATENPMTWNMGLNDNADLKTSLKDVIIGLYEGRYATGEEFAAAMDALY